MKPSPEMDHKEKVILYVYGLLEDLKVKGLVAGEGAHQITWQGDQARAQLLASGFRPTDEEIDWAMSCIMRGL